MRTGAGRNCLPHDHARSRAYRWGEDGLAGFSDIEQRLCLGLALWNGRDPVLKERAFGLTGEQGNHGEDVKEYWWYLDAIRSHAWNRWRYHYPQGPFPYQDLIDVNRSRDKFQPEYELVDTGAFSDDKYWIAEVTYAKAGPDGAAPGVLFCENETNTSRLSGGEPITPYPKDGINDHVVHGAPTVNPGRTGTKCSFWYKLTVEPGSTAQLQLRLRPTGTTAATRPFGKNFSDVLQTRESEADEFYQELTPRTASDDEAMVMRQAFAGMLWSKQLFYYDVKRWLDGDPSQPTPPAERRNGRNAK